MARIDRLIQATFQAGADALLIPSGDRIVLVTGSERRTASPQTAPLSQVEELLAEIVPPEDAAAVAREGSHAFSYKSPSGAVRVTVTRAAGSLSIQAAPIRAEVPREAEARAPATGGSAAMDALLHMLVDQKCSDLHLSAGNPPLFRQHGEMVQLGPKDPLTAEQVRALLFSITPDSKKAEFHETHDSDYSYEIPDVARFRCNLFLDRKGMGGVFRVIPTKIASAKELGLPESILKLCELNKGLVVVTGPTGSGKSTTLASMIDHINRTEASHIITIEDPIEFVHPGHKSLINQREIGSHTKGFKHALRAALREDPDIVLVGEMRDLETVAIAIETAETGHLVFGTLHTNTAASTVDRIIDQFPADRQNQVRTMLSESLKGVIAQTLCKKKGGGRVAALEILIVTSAVSNLIREGKTFQIASIIQTGKALGMVTMSDALMDLVKKDLVEPAEAYACAVNKAEMKSLLERAGHRVEGA